MVRRSRRVVGFLQKNRWGAGKLDNNLTDFLF